MTATTCKPDINFSCTAESSQLCTAKSYTPCQCLVRIPTVLQAAFTHYVAEVSAVGQILLCTSSNAQALSLHRLLSFGAGTSRQ